MARGSVAASTGDAVRSVAILAGILAVIALVFAIGRPDARLPEPVDYLSVVDYVRGEYPYDVLAPVSVPADWRATSVDHTADDRGHRWRVGFLIGDDGFVGLEQADGEIQSYLADRLRDFVKDGSVVVDGMTWQRWVESGGNPDRALVLVDGGAVTKIRGPETYELLERLAASLRS